MITYENGYPNLTLSQAAYVAAVRERGFAAAHTQLLTELREYFANSPKFARQPRVAVRQADLFQGGLLFALYEAGLGEFVPTIAERDVILISVFGAHGRALVAREQAGADQEVKRYMRETGITDEAEARRRYVNDMLEAMSAVVENSDEILGLANTLEQAEDAVRRAEDKEKRN